MHGISLMTSYTSQLPCPRLTCIIIIPTTTLLEVDNIINTTQEKTKAPRAQEQVNKMFGGTYKVASTEADPGDVNSGTLPSLEKILAQ